MKKVVNKKVRNATPQEYNGIRFRSKLEVLVYKTLIESGFTVLHEPDTYTLWEGFKPSIPLYSLSKDRKRITLESRKLVDITYSPDFYLEYEGIKVIIEAKGSTNDVFPYKFKMFRKLMENLPDKEDYLLLIIYNKRQLLESIKIIQDYATSRKNQKDVIQLAGE